MTFQYIRHTATNSSGGGPSTPTTTTLDAVALWGDTHGGSLLDSTLNYAGGILTLPGGIDVGSGAFHFGAIPGYVQAQDASSNIMVFMGANPSATPGQPDGQFGWTGYPNGEGPAFGVFNSSPSNLGLYTTGNAAGPFGGQYKALSFNMPANGSPPYATVDIAWGTDAVGSIGLPSSGRPKNIYSSNLVQIGVAGTIWSPTAHQNILQLSGDGGGTVDDYGVVAFSSTSTGTSPYTRGALQWVNNVSGSSGTAAQNIIAMFSYDGLSADSSYDGFSFYANDVLGTNTLTKFLNIAYQPNGGNPVVVFHSEPSTEAYSFDIANHTILDLSFDPTFGAYLQCPRSIIKEDADNAGVFGGIETLYRSAYKYGFFGVGGVTIGGASATWTVPPQLLSVKGDAAAAYGVFFNTAAPAASGLLCGVTSAGAGQLLHQGAFSLSLGVNNTVAYTITTSNRLQNVLSANEATGVGTALLGTNSPAVTNTAPYTWIKMTSSDGSTVYVPAWK